MPAHSTAAFKRISWHSQQAQRRICPPSAPNGSNASAHDLAVQEDVLVRARRHPAESGLAAHPRAAMPAHSTSVFKRIPWRPQQAPRRICPCSAPTGSDAAHATSVLKSMSLHLPAGPAPGTVAAAPAGKRARGAAPRRLEPRRGSGAVRGPQRGAPAGHLQGTERIRAAQASPVFHRFPRKRPARRWARRVGRRRWPRCPRPRHRLARSTATNGLAVDSLVGLVRAIETVVDVSQSMTLLKAWPLAGSPRALAPEEHSAERAACGWPST